MTPIHELLNRIHWDRAFGAAAFRVGYIDRVAGGLVHARLVEPFLHEGEHFSVVLRDEKGEPHEVPLHRIREVRRDDELIWQRPRQPGADPLPLP
ncbi:MAG: DUF504 domain-containing protein [Halothiobacillaceae bacterium]|nr:MAG: DUF504 domain-containing protein [Halothiobacillaceae bacterium]